MSLSELCKGKVRRKSYFVNHRVSHITVELIISSCVLPCYRWARCIVVGRATSSFVLPRRCWACCVVVGLMSSLLCRPWVCRIVVGLAGSALSLPCCHWAIVELTMPSFGLPRQCCIDVVLAILSLGLLYRRWVCHVILGFPKSTLGPGIHLQVPVVYL